MTRPALGRLAYLVGLAVLGALPLVVPRPSRDARCARDATAIDAGRAVEVVGASGERHRFCGVGCAHRWIEARGEHPRSVLVVDEPSGVPVDAAHAWFVESLVPAVEAAGDHVHAFARREDAARHAAAYHGRVLEGAERPFPRPVPGAVAAPGAEAAP